MTGNDERALWAKSAVAAFLQPVSRTDAENAVCDLIADLGHLCDRENVDFLAVLETAVGHWLAEQRDPDGIDHLPRVAVTVTANDDRARRQRRQSR